MATLLDYLFPQTMEAGRRADAFTAQQEALKRKQALETLSALAAQPDQFHGVQPQPPSPEMVSAYQQGTGAQWPMVQNAPTGAPPPGVQEPVPGLASNLPEQTLAVMRSPIAQTTNEMGQKAVAEAMAKIKGQETTLANQGNLPAREFQAKAQAIPGQIETLSGVLKPYGYDPTDVAAQVVGKYPGAREAELKRMSHYPPRDPTMKLYSTDQGWLPAEQAVGKGKPPTASAANAISPEFKWAQDFIKRITPVVTGQISPITALLMGQIPESSGKPEMIKALQSGNLPPELKAMYDRAVQIVNQSVGVPATPEQTTTSNDPLGIR